MKTKPVKTACILSIILVFLCIVSILFLIYFPGKDSKYTALIYVDGVLYESIPLYRVITPYHFSITTEDGHYNEISIENGSVRISSADCPDRICVQQGAVTNNLVPITCLPHRLVIQLVPVHTPESRPDAITH